MTRVQVLGENSFPFDAIQDKRPRFEAALEGYDPTATDDRDALTGEYDVLVDYRTDSSLTDDRLDALASVTTSKRSSSSACASATSDSRPTTRTRTGLVSGLEPGGGISLAPIVDSDTHSHLGTSDASAVSRSG